MSTGDIKKIGLIYESLVNENIIPYLDLYKKIVHDVGAGEEGEAFCAMDLPAIWFCEFGESNNETEFKNHFNYDGRGKEKLIKIARQFHEQGKISYDPFLYDIGIYAFKKMKNKYKFLTEIGIADTEEYDTWGDPDSDDPDYDEGYVEDIDEQDITYKCNYTFEEIMKRYPQYFRKSQIVDNLV